MFIPNPTQTAPSARRIALAPSPTLRNLSSPFRFPRLPASPSQGPAPTPRPPTQSPSRYIASLRRPLPDSLRQTLLLRARYLRESDRAFLTQLLADGRTCRELAAISLLKVPITGPASRASVCIISRQARNTARILQRRYSRLVSRLLSPQFNYVLHSLSDMSPTRARICTLHFIHGFTMRQVARTMCLPYATVRQICDHTTVKAQAQSLPPHLSCIPLSQNASPTK